jgi:hypothetical protein
MKLNKLQNFLDFQSKDIFIVDNNIKSNYC